MRMLYHLSNDPNLTVLTHRVPKSAASVEDQETPRVCFAASINGALNAIARYTANNHMHPMYTYSIPDASTVTEGNDRWSELAISTRNEFTLTLKEIELMNLASRIETGLQLYPFYYVYIPSRWVACKPATSVYDHLITGEVWVEEPIEVTLIGGIYVISSTNLGKTTKIQGSNIQSYSYHYITTPPEYRDPFDLLHVDKHIAIHDKIDELLDYSRTCDKLLSGTKLGKNTKKVGGDKND